jgi:hypothetical protein
LLHFEPFGIHHVDFSFIRGDGVLACRGALRTCAGTNSGQARCIDVRRREQVALHVVARPLLLKHKFGATFFVTEGWDFATNKKDYMTWEEIASNSIADGFEIGNHTRDHKSVTDKSVRDFPPNCWRSTLGARRMASHEPVSFAYPGNSITKDALKPC